MAECLSEIADAGGPVDAKEELLEECESIWKQMEECQRKLMLLGKDTLLQSDAKLSLLMLRWKALTVEHRQWQVKDPEIISTHPDVLLELGKEEASLRIGVPLCWVPPGDRSLVPRRVMTMPCKDLAVIFNIMQQGPFPGLKPTHYFSRLPSFNIAQVLGQEDPLRIECFKMIHG